MKNYSLLLLFLSMLTFSCKTKPKPENYIDIKIQKSREYTVEERANIRLALKRFNESIVIENGLYVVKVKSAAEIGIPNEFFYIFKMGIDDTNDLVKEAGPGWELAKPN
ncbi:MAG: hypothetical protein PF541_07810 [Prolixibacteraceae bacterium]|jgi:hypothetical protein|nr:hypothetical protein [Prolixibacteraceae bacterium]